MTFSDHEPVETFEPPSWNSGGPFFDPRYSTKVVSKIPFTVLLRPAPLRVDVTVDTPATRSFSLKVRQATGQTPQAGREGNAQETPRRSMRRGIFARGVAARL